MPKKKGNRHGVYNVKTSQAASNKFKQNRVFTIGTSLIKNETSICYITNTVFREEGTFTKDSYMD